LGLNLLAGCGGKVLSQSIVFADRVLTMRACLIFMVLVAAVPNAGAEQSAILPFESPAQLASQGTIDRLVFSDLKRQGIEPAEPCSDAVFLRRAYLDCIGTLPTADEARQFLADTDPNKRRKLVDRLLERGEFADYWAMKWCDVLRVKAEFPINLWPNAVQAYHRWIRASIQANTAYDRFARALLTSNGSNFRAPQVNFYRAVQSREPAAIADAVALTFMGERAKNWSEERRSQLAEFFLRISYKQTAEWKEEIVYFDPFAPANATAREVVFPDGSRTSLQPTQDPREVFADWLLKPNNPWFARCVANRVWFWLLGRGIIHEPDDIRPDNPPSNPQLLAYLEREVRSSRYDLKKIYRLILNSNTYQLSSIPRTTSTKAEAHFASYPLRRLDAEVLADALCQITGTTEDYSSLIPEPYTFIPAGERSIALADGSITSAWLEMFGRPPRDTGLATERDNRPTAAQRLEMLNSSHIRNKIERSEKLRQLARSSRNPLDVVVNLYLTILSRYPTAEELKVVNVYAQSDEVKRSEVLIDLAWALVNSAEFQYRH
jgi:hypothetical protein